MAQKWKGILQGNARMYLFLNVEAFPVYTWVCFLTKCRTGLLICNRLLLLWRGTCLMSSYNSTKNRLLCQVESPNTSPGRMYYTKRDTWKPYSAYRNWDTGSMKYNGNKVRISQSRAGSRWFELHACCFNGDTLGCNAQNVWCIPNTHGSCKAKFFTYPLISSIHIEWYCESQKLGQQTQSFEDLMSNFHLVWGV